MTFQILAAPLEAVTIKYLPALAAAAVIMAATPTEPAESLLQVPGPQGPLEGALLTPGTGLGPVVLIIPGSGPVDRDGNSPPGLNAGTYRLLAEGLAANGIKSLRIDKRGMFGSRAAIADANAVTIADYASDVRAWTSALRQRTGAACVWLLGHSEGGLVALAAARQEPDGLCGLLLVATPGRPLGEVLREQLAANPANAPILEQAMAAIDSLEAGRRVDAATLNPVLLPLFRQNVQGFMIDLLSYDPAALLRSYAGPVLILQGQQDLQVSRADAVRLRDSAPQAQLKLLPDTSHVLKRAASPDLAANYATYADPRLPLAPEVIPHLVAFLKAAHGVGP